jgi:hypothetical protein
MVQENTIPDKATWRVRPYGEGIGDYQTVSGWKEQRGLGILCENALPPDGVIVEMNGEPVAASWLYLCHGIGVAFWEGLVTRPGLSLRQSREACAHCVGLLKTIARANDVGLIKTYTTDAIAQEAMKLGFMATGSGLISLITKT